MEITEFIVKAIIIFNAIRVIATGPQQRWIFELLEINSRTSDPDLIDLKLEVVRLDRWQYGFSGFINLKADCDDDVEVRVTMERSKHRAGPYTLFPMGMEKEKLSHIMNVYYKPLIQPEALKCCKNAPNLKEKFKAPLTKRYITVSNCTVATDNFPNILMEGYYRARLYMSGPVDVFLETLVLVEAKMF